MASRDQPAVTAQADTAPAIAPQAVVAEQTAETKAANGAVPATAIELPTGLELIETRHHAVIEQPQPQVQLGRRRKAAPVIADEPLKQVETQ